MGINLSVCFKVWDTEGSGYVSLQYRDKNVIVKGRPKWGEKAFKYPDDKNGIIDFVKAHAGSKDLYWSPHVYTTNTRRKEYALPTCGFLWSDLDEVHPDKCVVRPTIAWKSSDDRYQALWFLTERMETVHAETLNKELAYANGADKSGWDVTQVLRIPGSNNYKYEPKQGGELMWQEVGTTATNPEALITKLTAGKPAPVAKATPEQRTLEQLLDEWHVSGKLREVLLTPEGDIEVGNRSDRLWELEHRLVELNIPVKVVVDMIKLSGWNKYKGRRDEDVRLNSEVLKAEEEYKAKHKRKPKELKDENWLTSYDEFMAKDINPPQWLVQGIWQEGTYGIIAGEPKSYKSVQATDLALSVASGSPYLGVFPVLKQGVVLYIQEENGEAIVHDRIMKIAAHKGLLVPGSGGMNLPVSIPLYVSNNQGFALTEPEDQQRIEQAIEQLRPVMVIFDPLYMMMGGVDENSATEVAPILHWLTSLRNKYNTALVVCHHYNKGTSTSARGGSRIRGSGAFHAWVESAMYVQSDANEKGHVTIEREFRAASPMSLIDLRIEMGDPGETHYRPQVNTEGLSSMTMGASMAALYAKLKLGPATVEELKAHLRVPKTTLIQLMALMIEGGVVIRNGSNYMLSTEVIEGGTGEEYVLEEASV